MASPSDHSNSEVVYTRQNKGPPFKFLVPLVYAPVLPLSNSTFFEEEPSFKGPAVYYCVGWGFYSWFLFGVSLLFLPYFALITVPDCWFSVSPPFS
ncbi:hypothetical protein CXB51_015004 [Gossypium anomalum]|uniref:Uncharacterized protein n=1 Tax=Gossypium anomalum TaxID=47600 RepID=A0A8J5YKI1_9ROSI|nr:hypothetical protein CXB51_015004 [Gossypium anomalum]